MCIIRRDTGEDWNEYLTRLMQKAAVYANRRRTRGQRGRKLQRLRSEKTERTFAHVCETGGARRTWLVGIDKLRKRYLLSAAAHNLGVLMRVLFGMGTPKGLQQFLTDLEEVVSSWYLAWLAVMASAAAGHHLLGLPRHSRHEPAQGPKPPLVA